MPIITEMRAVCQTKIPNAKGKMVLKGSLWNIIFSRHISIYLTYAFVKVRVTANQVTMLMLVIGFLSFLLAIPHILWMNIASLLLFLFFYILDCSDGEVARWTKKCSLGGVYLDYAAHTMCNAPLMAACALHYYLLTREFIYGLAAFATIMMALWHYYYKLIIPAIVGREKREQFKGNDIVSSSMISDTIRFIRMVLSDSIFAPMFLIIMIIISHFWTNALLIGAAYGFISTFYLAALYLVVGFLKAKKFDQV